MSISILEYFNSLETTYPSIHSEINKELTKLDPQKFFDYKKHLTDPFQVITTNPDTDNSCLNHLYEWYNSINPEYKKLTKLDPQIPMFKGIQPYRTLLLGIAKDLIILKYTKKFPIPDIPEIINMSNNHKLLHNTTQNTTQNNIKSIRSKRSNIQTKYNKNNKKKTFFYSKINTSTKDIYNQYVNGTKNSRALNTFNSDNDINSIIESILILLNNTLTIENLLYYKYLQIINIIDKYLQLFSFGKINYNKFTEQLFNYTKTSFIIYPTFNPITYTKVIYFMQAPVVNFYMINTRKLIHKKYEFPYHQIYHDLLNHAGKTHKAYNSEISIELKPIFSKYNITINVLKKYINCNINNFLASTKNNVNNDNINKFILSYALFIMCHELGFNNIISISNTIEELNRLYLFDFLLLNDIDDSLPSPKYDMSKIKTMISSGEFFKNAILQLEDNKDKMEAESLKVKEDMEQKIQIIIERYEEKKQHELEISKQRKIVNKRHSTLGKDLREKYYFRVGIRHNNSKFHTKKKST